VYDKEGSPARPATTVEFTPTDEEGKSVKATVNNEGWCISPVMKKGRYMVTGENISFYASVDAFGPPGGR
jgi:hypothetical protein